MAEEAFVKDPILTVLEEDLLQYDRVYLLGEGIDFGKLARAADRSEKKMIFYFPENLCAEEEVSCFPAYRRISPEQENVILNLYRMYEFTDNFHLLDADSRNYGNLLNYMESGVLTAEEVYEALL
ncbi:MAG: hypothetical protein K6G83_05475 [Lachnospiraceae bacterium]|nr:hypothetical protein [Lachnospiraceae bacterium]